MALVTTTERTEINETISGIDILPTLYNLYGIDYDSRRGEVALFKLNGAELIINNSSLSLYISSLITHSMSVYYLINII